MATKKKQIDKVDIVKAASRNVFRNMPKPKRIGDKRKKAPRFPERQDD